MGVGLTTPLDALDAFVIFMSKPTLQCLLVKEHTMAGLALLGGGARRDAAVVAR